MRKIEVRTVGNGYALTVGKHEYLFFTEEQLMEGMLYHIGMGNVEAHDREDIHNIVSAISVWADSKDSLKAVVSIQAECERLRGIIREKMGELQRMRIRMESIRKSEVEQRKRDDIRKKGAAVKYTEAVYEALMLPLTIDMTGLPTRVLTVLKSAGKRRNTTIGDVVRLAWSDIINTFGGGKAVMETFDRWMTERGLHMGMDVDAIMWLHEEREKAALTTQRT